jgi:cell division protein FtsZ
VLAYALEGLEEEIAGTPIQNIPPRVAAEQRGARPAAQARTPGDPGVRIGPFRPDPSLVARQAAESEHHAAEAARAEHFIPAAAERPDSLQPRMPKVEDFPPVAQRQLRAQQSGGRGHDEERRPRGLLARLASGLTRRDDDEYDTRHDEHPPMEAEPRVVAAQAPAHAPTPSSEFAKPQPRRMGEVQGAAGALDTRGRPVPVDANRDDHLEIPAFLRRQSS